MVIAFICEMLVIFNGERKRPGSRSGKDLVREGRLDAFCRRLRREVRNHVAVRVPWSHLCCEALWPFPAEPGAYFCSFWNGKTFCDSLSSPPPLLPASLASSPLTECRVLTALTLWGLFVCILEVKQLTSVSWGRRACFSSSLPVLLKCLSLKHRIFIVGLLVGNLERMKSFKRVAEACLLFLKTIILLLCQPSVPGVSGKYLASGGTMGPGELGPSWGHGCWLPPICQKSQARGFS